MGAEMEFKNKYLGGIGVICIAIGLCGGCALSCSSIPYIFCCRRIQPTNNFAAAPMQMPSSYSTMASVQGVQYTGEAPAPVPAQYSQTQYAHVGQNKQGQAQYGQAQYGQARYGQAPYMQGQQGPAQYGQTPYMQGQQEPAQYGQAQYAHGQSQYGQIAYGQIAYGQTQYEQPQGEQAAGEQVHVAQAQYAPSAPDGYFPQYATVSTPSQEK
jgi:predicted membrane metal-binding protein